jgi:hypothetical protein
VARLVDPPKSPLKRGTLSGCRDREIAIFDEPDDLLLMPGFAPGLALTVGEVFGWLVD